MSVFSLRVGDCLVDEMDEVRLPVPRLPHVTPHDYEVFHVFEIAGLEYPGEEVVREEAVIGASLHFRRSLQSHMSSLSWTSTRSIRLVKVGYNKMTD